MTSIASWNAETIFAPAGDRFFEREVRGLAGRFPVLSVFLSTTLRIDFTAPLFSVTHLRSVEFRREFLILAHVTVGLSHCRRRLRGNRQWSHSNSGVGDNREVSHPIGATRQCVKDSSVVDFGVVAG